MPRTTKTAPEAPRTDRITKPSPRQGEVQTVPLSRLRPSSINPRGDEGDTDALVESIRHHGFFAPLVVRPAGDEFEVIAGNRRLAALKQLGWKHPVPVLVRTDLTTDDTSAIAIAVSENAEEARVNLTLMDVGRAAKVVMDETGKNATAVAKMFATSKTAISRALKLLDLPDDVRQAAEAKGLCERSIVALSLIPDEDRATIVAELGAKATVREIEALRKQVERQHALAAVPEPTTGGTTAEAPETGPEPRERGAAQGKSGKAGKAEPATQPTRRPGATAWRSPGEKTTTLRRLAAIMAQTGEADQATAEYCEIRGAVGLILWDRGDLSDPLLPDPAATDTAQRKVLAVFAKIVAAEAAQYVAPTEPPK